MGGIAFDTSVIIPALLSWHEHHAAALPIVRDALVQDEAILPLPSLVEAFAVMTRLPAPWRLRSEDAHGVLTGKFRGRAELVGLDGDQAWDLLDRALGAGVSGGATYDAHIVHCARKAGAIRLATFNRRHFERLDLGGIDLVVPGRG